MTVCLCGKRIVIGVTDDHHTVKLDPEAKVYAIVHGGERVVIVHTTLCMAAHVCSVVPGREP